MKRLEEYLRNCVNPDLWTDAEDNLSTEHIDNMSTDKIDKMSTEIDNIEHASNNIKDGPIHKLSNEDKKEDNSIDTFTSTDQQADIDEHMQEDLPTSVQNRGLSVTKESANKDQENVKLKKEVLHLRHQLVQCKNTIHTLQEKEKEYKLRLSSAISNSIKSSHKYEDLSLGDKRPSKLIQLYSDLYSEGRLEAFDALDNLPEISNFNDLKGKLLFSVIVLSFRSVNTTLSRLRNQLKHMLCLPATEEVGSDNDSGAAVKGVQESVHVYLCKTCDSYDVTANVQEVCSQMYSTLYDYPSLRSCQPLTQYAHDCVRIAWSLTVQNPPYIIKYDSQLFDGTLHTRFYTSDLESDVIKMVIWPPLLEGKNGSCVYKGVVLT